MEQYWQHIVIGISLLSAVTYLVWRWIHGRKKKSLSPCQKCQCGVSDIHDLTGKSRSDG